MVRRQYRNMSSDLLIARKTTRRGRKRIKKARYNQNVRQCNTCGVLKENGYDKFGFQRKPDGHYKVKVDCRECTNRRYRERYAAYATCDLPMRQPK